MKPHEDLSVTIPAAIAELHGLKLSERAALAHIATRPRCSNAALAKRLSLTRRGVESLLHRLRNAGLIRQVGRGRARQLHLAFPVEQHTLCGKTANGDSHNNCGDGRPCNALAKPAMATADLVELHLIYYERCFEANNYGAARQHLETIRKRLEDDAGVPEEAKVKWIVALKLMEDRCFAINVVEEIADRLPPGTGARLAITLCRATAEQLATFRRRVESEAGLNRAVDVLALIGE